MNASRNLYAFVAVVFLAACTSMPPSMKAEPMIAKPAGVNVQDGLLTNAASYSLYTFDRDTVGKSACVGACAVNWPPFLAPANAAATGDFTVITRDDGKMQWAYKGKPLYTFANDKVPGEKSGDGFAGGIWHIVKI